MATKQTARQVADSKRLRANLKTLNLEYVKAKQQGVDALNFYKTAREQIEQISKSTSKRGLGNLGVASRNKKAEQQLLELTDKLLQSNWATEQGRELIYKKSFKTASDRYGLTKTQWLKSIDVFQNESFQKLSELANLDSEQINKALVKSGKKQKGQTLEEFVEKRYNKNINKLNAMTDKERQQFWTSELDRWASRDTTNIKKV